MVEEWGKRWRRWWKEFKKSTNDEWFVEMQVLILIIRRYKNELRRWVEIVYACA